MSGTQALRGISVLIHMALLALASSGRARANFYGRNANGPVTIARRADARKARKSQAPQHPSPAKPARARN
jgi:hypothetical protein